MAVCQQQPRRLPEGVFRYPGPPWHIALAQPLEEGGSPLVAKEVIGGKGGEGLHRLGWSARLLGGLPAEAGKVQPLQRPQQEGHGAVF